LPSSTAALRSIAAAIATMTRQFNINEGLKPEDDHLPQRFHREALPTGQTLSFEEMEYMLKDYYILRGWDSQGAPATE